jgi:hypothetical protein
MKAIPRVATGVLVLAGLALLAGCTHLAASPDRPHTADAAELEMELRQTIAACRVNARELDKIYDNLHHAATNEAARSRNDIQLNYIQKAYLYVHQARLVAAYQIRLLSDFPYINKDLKNDFWTLRALDLDQAVSEMEDASWFLDVYATFINDPQALADIENARQMIGGSIYLYEKLLVTIHPMVNPAAPFSRDPYNPFSRGT